MLTPDQRNRFEELTDEVVDQTVIEFSEDSSDLDNKDKNEIWAANVGTAAPVLSGVTDLTCEQNGISPCASCDCC